MRASAASVGDVAVWCVAGAGTLIWSPGFASAQDLTNGRRAWLLVLKMRRLHGTSGIRALIGPGSGVRGRAVRWVRAMLRSSHELSVCLESGLPGHAATRP